LCEVTACSPEVITNIQMGSTVCVVQTPKSESLLFPKDERK